MADSPDPGPESGVRVVRDVLPPALLLGGLAAAARAALVANGPLGRTGEVGRTNRLVAAAERWPELLTEALFASVVTVLVVGAARARGSRALTWTAFVFGTLVFAAALTEFPRPPAVHSVPALVAAALLALLATALDRLRFRGPLALALGAVVGVGLPLGLANGYRASSGRMPVRQVLYDLVAAPDLFRTVEARPGAAPAPGVLTPAVDQRTDTGDKPALVLPPPAAQEMTVPPVPAGTRLVAAAGADQAVIQRLPAGLEELRVEYRILVDERVAWSRTIAHRRMPPGTFDTTGFEWAHVEADGARGVAVESGDVVRFETRFAPGQETAGLADEGLRLGFGGVTLERTFTQPRAVATPDAPNVVYVVMDTLRRDRVGLYGYDRDTTPRLDAFAADALILDDAYTTSSWTWPSTASLLTGWLPDAHGVKSSKSCTLSQKLPTLAEALQERGYTTAAFVGNPIVEPNRYFDQGFESFDVVVPDFRMSDEVVPPALAWLEAHAPIRFFLYLHLVDPHTPHRPHPEEAARLGLSSPPEGWPERGLDGVLQRDEPSDAVEAYASDLYDASVATGDRWFGEVLDALERLGLSDRTIVVFTSDHGEELFERGRHGHGHEVHAELVRAPLVLRGPGVPRGRRPGVVSNRHVAPTIAALCGAELPGPGGAVHLVDDTLPDEALFETTKGVWGAARYQQLYGLRRGGDVTHWRATGAAAGEVADGDLRRYDAITDPEERSDVARLEAAAARETVARMLDLVEAAKDARPPLVLGVGAQGRSQLEWIGYAGKDEPENVEDR